jgi:hypothetical protein
MARSPIFALVLAAGTLLAVAGHSLAQGGAGGADGGGGDHPGAQGGSSGGGSPAALVALYHGANGSTSLVGYCPSALTAAYGSQPPARNCAAIHGLEAASR